MRQRSFIVLAVALAVLVVGAVGVYAYDKTRDDMIAKGVSAGGVDLSGMKPDEARETLRRAARGAAQEAVVVKYAGHRYKLSPRRARKVHVDTDEMVQQALDASHKGNILTPHRARDHRRQRAREHHGRGHLLAAAPSTEFAKDIQKHIDQDPRRRHDLRSAPAGVQKVDSQDGSRSSTPRR